MKGPSKARFEKIFSEGKRVNGQNFRLIALPGDSLVGYATSKKIGNIARRNRAKRRAREALRANLAEWSARLDYVVIVNAKADAASFDEMRTELGRLLVGMKERWANELECS